MMRTCAKCGETFTASGRMYLCSDCRKPVSDYESTHFLRGIPLTSREIQIVAQVASGKANKEIAACMHLTPGTVKEYIHRSFRKLDVGNRVQLTLWALAHGDTMQQ